MKLDSTVSYWTSAVMVDLNNTHSRKGYIQSCTAACRIVSICEQTLEFGSLGLVITNYGSVYGSLLCSNEALNNCTLNFVKDHCNSPQI